MGLIVPPNPNSAPDMRAPTQLATAARAAARREVAPKVAVCICTRNRPQELRRALASIAGSSFLPRQVLVSDDSDPELAGETAAVCRAFPDVTYISGPRRGLSANRNNCLSHLSDDVDAVVFIDDDVVLPPSFLPIASERIRRAQPNAIVTGFEYRDGFEVTPHNCSFWGHQEKRPESNSDVHAICINATIFPRSLFESLSFDELLRYGSEEADICARAERAGFLVTFAPDLFAYHWRSQINREEYAQFQDASRLYATFKRYAWIEGNSGKALTYSVLAPLHLLASVTAKRRSRREIRAALAAIGTAARYARSYQRSRLGGFRDDAGPAR
jgi:glycosyltransferase involved in cell wall biosynthesis